MANPPAAEDGRLPVRRRSDSACRPALSLLLPRLFSRPAHKSSKVCWCRIVHLLQGSRTVPRLTGSKHVGERADGSSRRLRQTLTSHPPRRPWTGCRRRAWPASRFIRRARVTFSRLSFPHPLSSSQHNQDPSILQLSAQKVSGPPRPYACQALPTRPRS